MKNLGDIEKQVLIGTRVHGPCSISCIAKAMGIGGQTVYAAMYRLRKKNLANRIGEARYDVTRMGRRVFDEQSKAVEDLPLLDLQRRPKEEVRNARH